MGRRLTVALVGVVVLGLVLGSFEYISVQQTSITYGKVALSGVETAPLNSSLIVSEIPAFSAFLFSPSASGAVGLLATYFSAIKLNITLEVTNLGVLPVYAPAETHQVFLDGIFVATGSTPSTLVWSGSTTKVMLTETVSTAELLPLVKEILSSGGMVSYYISGNAGGIQFVKSGQFNLVQELVPYIPST